MQFFYKLFLIAQKINLEWLFENQHRNWNNDTITIVKCFHVVDWQIPVIRCQLLPRWMSRRIYLDDAMHGEVKASSACNRNGYQYCLTGITAGQSRDIYVKVRGHAMFSILFRKPPSLETRRMTWENVIIVNKLASLIATFSIKIYAATPSIYITCDVA